MLVTNSIPSGCTFDSVTLDWASLNSDSYYTNGNGAIVCKLGTMDNGASHIVTITARAGSAGVVNATASVGSDATDLNLSDNVSEAATTVMTLPKLVAETVTKSTNAFSIKITGQSGLTYTIQSSTNLTTWSDVTNFTLSSVGTTFTAPATNTIMFYRVIYQ